MEIIQQPGGAVMVAHAPVWDRSSSTLCGRDHLLIGRMPGAVLKSVEAGFSWYLGQLYGCVAPGLIFTQCLFEGLRRDMRVREDGNAASRKMAATWAQGRDAKFVQTEPGIGHLEYYAPEPNRVFCVYISRNEMLEEYPQIFGWAEHWTWIAADPARPGAPVDWETRYDRVLWTA